MNSQYSAPAVCLPTPALRPFIARCAGYCANGLQPGTHAGLPSRHVDLIKAQRPALAEAAVASGYHDQAHMTLEWNTLAGCTPKSWIASELPFLQDYGLAARDD
jgi:AraC-like DNA-binding protein